MIAWLLLFVWVWPLLLCGPAVSRRLWWLPPVGALPALAAALSLPLGTRLELPWLFLGTHLGLDETARLYLSFTAILWLAAGIFAADMRRRSDRQAGSQAAYGGRFNAFFLLAMAGNFWLILGMDLISFYVGFAVMGLASYALVVHDGSVAALRAGKVYLMMALGGEVLLFAAIAMIAAETGSTLPTPERLAELDDLTIALALLGLGVKAGVFPLHLWLPLAHPAAPIPASAVLSGTMIKVAMLGWLRFLPAGAVALPHWGSLLIAAGLFTLFYALVVGLTQRDLKVILAYSSISKMGFLVTLLGLVLLEPVLAPAGIAAITLYAAHHGLVKGGLFLGVGLRKSAAVGQGAILAGLAVLALAMAGAPLTSGAVAKYATKPVSAALPAAWTWIAAAFALSTIGTTLLMARFVWLGKATVPHPGGRQTAPLLAWAVLIGLILIFPFALGNATAWFSNAIDVALGLALAAAVLLLAAKGRLRPNRLIGAIPAGDILTIVRPFYHWLRSSAVRIWLAWRALVAAGGQTVQDRQARLLARPEADAERELRTWPVAGALWLSIGALLLLFLLAAQAPRAVQDTPLPVAEETASAAPADASAAPRAPEARAPAPDSAAAPSSGLAPQPLATPTPESATPVMEEPAQREAPARHAGTAIDEATGRTPVQQPPEAAHSAKEPPTTQTAESVEAPQAAEAADGEQGIREPSGDAGQNPPCDPQTPFVFARADRPSERVLLGACRLDEAGRARPAPLPALDNELVRILQHNLAWLGFEPGPIDGMIGPQTREAIRAFQTAQGLRSTGGVTFELLRAIEDAIADHD